MGMLLMFFPLELILVLPCNLGFAYSLPPESLISHRNIPCPHAEHHAFYNPPPHFCTSSSGPWPMLIRSSVFPPMKGRSRSFRLEEHLMPLGWENIPGIRTSLYLAKSFALCIYTRHWNKRHIFKTKPIYFHKPTKLQYLVGGLTLSFLGPFFRDLREKS